MFVYATESEKGNGTMSENELELINMIRESEDPAKAMVTAIEVICRYIPLNRNRTEDFNQNEK